MSKEIRVGIVGCGEISYARLRCLAVIPQVELISSADTKRQAALKLKEAKR